MTRVRKYALSASFCAAFCTAALIQAAPPEQERFFEEKVRPILVARCLKCHGEEKQQGNLRLDDRASALAGGDSGAAVVPGKTAESLLIDAINYESFEMPPSGKLPAAEIEILTQWITQGAAWPAAEGAATGVSVRKVRGQITDEDRKWWAIQPLQKAALPAVAADAWSAGPADRFLLDRLQREGLQQAPEADPAALLRRVTFDLIGLPPTVEQIDAFTNNPRPDAYEQTVDRLLASPLHGQHASRGWLDLVRYAESDGYKLDSYRPHAWRYRDYVIDAFNSDLPYPQFIREQLAGDEIEPATARGRIAAGYLRLGIYEYNQRDVRTQWSGILNDLTDVTSDVFLGVGMSCARCHDHKFDPILQVDYFRLQAFFTPLLWRDDLPAASAAEEAAHAQQLAAWEAATAEIRRELEELEAPAKAGVVKGALGRFPDDVVPFLFKPAEERLPLERQIYYLCYRQADEEVVKIDYAKKLTGDKKTRWEELRKQLAEREQLRPQPLPPVMTASDVGPAAPPTLIPGKPKAPEVAPGVLTILDEKPLTLPSPTASGTGRRTALAQWLGDAKNPLTPRVLANRLWQQHFGRGLAESASDFGRLGQPPSHPELLDHLAAEFIRGDWSIKRLRRALVTSSAYRQASHGPETAASAKQDPANRFLGRMLVRRLQAEQIRDASLAVSGQLRLSLGGPAFEASQPHRSIYVKVKRNTRDPLLDVFDIPDGLATMPLRNITTTPLQALELINGPWMLARAEGVVKQIERTSPDSPEDTARLAYRLILGREPTLAEQTASADFLRQGPGDKAVTDLCHVLLNSSEFLYID